MSDLQPFSSLARVEAKDVALVRGGRSLFQRLSFSVSAGDMLEIRGPNGSGKTSLLRAIAGFLRPASGMIEVDGASERELALHYLGHRDGLKTQIDVRAHLSYWTKLLGGAVRDVDGALARVGLSALDDAPAGVLSQGQMRRLALARLISIRRPIWLLDEPANGLDASGKVFLAALIAEHRAAGGVVLAALHEPLETPGARILDLAQA